MRSCGTEFVKLGCPFSSTVSNPPRMRSKQHNTDIRGGKTQLHRKADILELIKMNILEFDSYKGSNT